MPGQRRSDKVSVESLPSRSCAVPCALDWRPMPGLARSRSVTPWVSRHPRPHGLPCYKVGVRRGVILKTAVGWPSRCVSRGRAVFTIGHQHPEDPRDVRDRAETVKRFHAGQLDEQSALGAAAAAPTNPPSTTDHRPSRSGPLAIGDFGFRTGTPSRRSPCRWAQFVRRAASISATWIDGEAVNGRF